MVSSTVRPWARESHGKGWILQHSQHAQGQENFLKSPEAGLWATAYCPDPRYPLVAAYLISCRSPPSVYPAFLVGRFGCMTRSGRSRSPE